MKELLGVLAARRDAADCCTASAGPARGMGYGTGAATQGSLVIGSLHCAAATSAQRAADSAVPALTTGSLATARPSQQPDDPPPARNFSSQGFSPSAEYLDRTFAAQVT